MTIQTLRRIWPTNHGFVLTTPQLVDLLYAHQEYEFLLIKAIIPPERFEAYRKRLTMKPSSPYATCLANLRVFALGSPSLWATEEFDDNAEPMESILLVISHFTQEFGRSVEDMTNTQLEFYDRFYGEDELPSTLDASVPPPLSHINSISAALEDPYGLQNLYEIFYGGNWTRGHDLLAPDFHYIRDNIKAARAIHEEQMKDIEAELHEERVETEWACTWHRHTGDPNAPTRRCNFRVVRQRLPIIRHILHIHLLAAVVSKYGPGFKVGSRKGERYVCMLENTHTGLPCGALLTYWGFYTHPSHSDHAPSFPPGMSLPRARELRRKV
ncbi:hypothetical protein FA15DRAFT_704812 [Coprinopsis marcescibilis]|uniref:Uncharacterized protein n=1 Tax=Coprinopsis marcescibilis TaxID=230819 RepID=A0A5C3KU71_COPMA|nr:hypothetical protein FA15DRAFT_704812 [Coprinopsis marcescibilis]